MPDNDIEKQLKNSADKITVKSFSERWNNVKDGINSEEGREILVESPVPAGNENNFVASYGNRKRNSLIIVLSLIFCAIVALAVVLPLTLRKKEPTYFGSADLVHVFVDDKEQYFNAIENAGYDIINLSEYDLEDFVLLLVADSDEIKGGKITVSDEEKGFICYVEFYDISVSVESDRNKYETFTVGSTVIEYLTQYDGSLYTTCVYAQHKSINYKLQYLSLTDNCTVFFEEIFS